MPIPTQYLASFYPSVSPQIPVKVVLTEGVEHKEESPELLKKTSILRSH